MADDDDDGDGSGGLAPGSGPEAIVGHIFSPLHEVSNQVN